MNVNRAALPRRLGRKTTEGFAQVSSVTSCGDSVTPMTPRQHHCPGDSESEYSEEILRQPSEKAGDLDVYKWHGGLLIDDLKLSEHF